MHVLKYAYEKGVWLDHSKRKTTNMNKYGVKSLYNEMKREFMTSKSKYDSIMESASSL